MKASSLTGVVRLPIGGIVERETVLRFTFDGLPLTGYRGDTLASALLANRIAIAGRSFKYHRPRGILACGVEEPNVLVTVGEGDSRIPLARATDVRLYDGLMARSVNTWPNARTDLAGLLDKIHRFLPAGFYYKTFMWPKWRLYEPFIRRLAGLARLDVEPGNEAGRNAKRRGWCDVLVVGGGPAGLAAALRAGRSGARVMLIEQSATLGGALLWNDELTDGLVGRDWVAGAVEELKSLANVRIFTNTVAFGYYDQNLIAALETVDEDHGAAAARQRLWKIRAAQVVLATGAIERPLLFRNNDRPGVMLASAALEYLARFAVRAGSRIVVATNNDSAYRTAVGYALAGASVTIADSRSHPGDHAVSLATGSGVRLIKDADISDAIGSPIKAVKIESAGGITERVACDLLCVSGGWNPAVHLFSQSGGKLRFDEQSQCFVPDRSVQQVRAAGACAGAFTHRAAIASGLDCGANAAADCGHGGEALAIRTNAPACEYEVPPLKLPGDGHDRIWIDFQNDVTLCDIGIAARENFVSVEHLKRYTTTGMALDQGKTSNVTALMALGALTGRSPAEVGTTTFRPPYVPISMAALAGQTRGHRFHPTRLLPLHAVHAASGGVFTDVADWQRVDYYPRPGETTAAAIRHEVLVARNGVGLFDASSLGKIEVFGRDAADFLDRVYANRMSNLMIGGIRYGLLLTDSGVIADDGICARLGEHRFCVSTTTGGAIATAAEFERLLQCEWPDLEVLVSPVTSQWASITAVGPSSRLLLDRLRTDISLDPAAFPHMTAREGRIAGHEARIFRVSFTGELSFEINVRAAAAEALWQALLDAGEDLDVAPIGLSAIDILRIEKGYIHVGSDTDGTTSPIDIGMGRPVLSKTVDFIGRRSLGFPHMVGVDRPQLVGLIGEDGRAPPPVGAVILGDRRCEPEGHVTSSCVSPTLQRGIGLGMLRNGRARHGEQLVLASGGATVRVTVAPPCFYDPEGLRLRA